MTVGILGGGLTGLTIGYLLDKKGIDFRILEKETVCGGLMRSLKCDGFTFDFGGSHVIFSKDNEALTFLVDLLGENKLTKKRNSAILYKDRFIKYPFENGLAGLSAEENYDCVYGFIKNFIRKQTGTKVEPANLKEWFYSAFGEGITEKYLLPYNTKIWKTPLENMSWSWVGRIPNPSLEDIIKSSIGIATEGYTHQLNFFYPLHGGIQAIIDTLVSSVKNKILPEFEVQRIWKDGDVWKVSNGKNEKSFNKLISTIPINELIKSINAPASVRTAASNLKYTSLITVMIGLDVEKLNNFSWIYIPDENVLSHRVSFPSNYSPYVVPSGKSSVLAEITCPLDGDIWKMSDSDIVNRVVDDLFNLKLFKRNDICFSSVKRTKYAYVVNDLSYDQNMIEIKDFLAQADINCVGRFGEFIYLNMDGCVRHTLDYMRAVF
ncbi:MAG: FAD-dependent oxidoreductase [Candidatus Bathyarchaeota archaeon]|nr:FAD-dependent oxidoreductase [Candidatus Bathyarchaeota archaeon]